MIFRDFRNHGKQRPHRFGEPRKLAMRSEEVKPLSFVIVLSRSAALLIVQCNAAKVGELSNSIVPPGKRFQHQSARGLVGLCEAIGKQADQRLGTFDQGADSRRAVRIIGMGCHVSEVILHLVVNLSSHSLRTKVGQSSDSATSRARSVSAGKSPLVREIIRSRRIRRDSSPCEGRFSICRRRRSRRTRTGAI